MSESKPTWESVLIGALFCGVGYGLAFEPGIGFAVWGRGLLWLSLLGLAWSLLLL